MKNDDSNSQYINENGDIAFDYGWILVHFNKEEIDMIDKIKRITGLDRNQILIEAVRNYYYDMGFEFYK